MKCWISWYPRVYGFEKLSFRTPRRKLGKAAALKVRFG
jgi:hypothetical protein